MDTPFVAKQQKKLAESFHALHRAEQPLILQNAWDCTSAKMAEQAGFSAIATTSSGISWANGYRDGEHIPPEIMVEAVQKIARVVAIPVSVDMEAGYASTDCALFEQWVEEFVRAGAVGINLEDTNPGTGTLNAITSQQALIQKAKAVGERLGINLFVNARTDAMTLNQPLSEKIADCIARAEAFKAAGADGIFVPFTQDITTVKTLKEAIELPLNILFTDALKVAALKQLKVNRISTGSRPILATMSFLATMAEELQHRDEWPSLQGTISYLEANNLF